MSRRALFLGLAVTFVSATGLAWQASPPESRTIYLTATDRNGIPVPDLAASDFEIKEGGKTVDVVRAAIAKDPLQIALIVDDNGTGLFRSGIARFVQRLEGHAVMSLSAVTGQTMKIVDYTPSAGMILEGVARLSARPATPDGGQLLEGISEAANELRRREAKRPVIVAFTVGGEEHSTVHSDHVLDQLRKSGAALHVFSVERSALRGTTSLGTPKDLLQENMHLSRVLGDGPKQTGGRHHSIVAAAGTLLSLQNLAAELTSQYQVVYTLPPGARRGERLNVSVKRKGVNILAPAKLPT